MDANVTLAQLEHVVQIEFPEIITSSKVDLNKLRINLTDKSFVEIFHSFSLPDRWAFHWERRHIDGKLYRHDNIPHAQWKAVSSFPWHYHNGGEDAVEYSTFGSDPVMNTRLFLKFVKSTKCR